MSTIPTLKLATSTKLAFDFHWLRETGFGKISGTLGLPLETEAEAGLEVVAESRFPSQVRVRAHPLGNLAQAAGQLAAAIVGQDNAAPSEGALELSRSILEKAMGALERKCAADLSCLCAAATSESPLLDGNGLCRPTVLELHLPFIDRKHWNTRWEALAHAEVETGADGRLTACLAPNKNTYQSTLLFAAWLLPRARTGFSFSLSYNDRRRLSFQQARSAALPLLRGCGFDPELGRWLETAHSETGAQDLEIALALALPGQLAEAWLEVPGERDPNFFPVFAAVSVAVQQALRRWLPYIYFSDLERYDDPARAYPLLVYQCTPPFPGQPRAAFTYDLMDRENTPLRRRSTRRELIARLGSLQQLLLAAGKPKTAERYSPQAAKAILAAVERQPRLLNGLLLADTFFVDALIRLGLAAREFNIQRQAVKELARFSEDFVATFHHRLRRLYGGQDFPSLGALLLIEATRALRPDTPLPAVLRIAMGDLEQTFVNADYRP